MKASKFSDAQKAYILKQGVEGTLVAEICRKAGISQATYFNWKKKYAGLLPDEMRRLKQLEDENDRLKWIVADLTLDREMLQDVIRRNLRGLLGSDSWAMGCWSLGVFRSEGPAGHSASMHRPTTKNLVEPIRLALSVGSRRLRRRVSATDTRWPASDCNAIAERRRVHVLLRREGWMINMKKTRRIYSELGLQMRNKHPKRRVKAKLRDDRKEAAGPNEVWALGECLHSPAA